LNEKVEAPSGDCIMLFDCWTPAAVRGRGYYGQTVGLISKLIRDQGKRPWIFTAATNIASVRGLERVGFQRRYSLVRQHILWWQRIKGKVPKIYDSLSEEISARA
jgi:predicted GNAT family acetyltransferase